MVPKKILLCTDFSENSVGAREYAIDFANAFDADLLILHVLNSSRLGFPAFETGVPFDLQEVLKSVEDSIQSALNATAEECRRVLKGNLLIFSRIGIPSNEIVKLADEEKADLIIMGTHGWTGFKHLVLGSTAENVVRTSVCPVMTVKSSEE